MYTGGVSSLAEQITSRMQSQEDDGGVRLLQYSAPCSLRLFDFVSIS